MPPKPEKKKGINSNIKAMAAGFGIDVDALMADIAQNATDTIGETFNQRIDETTNRIDALKNEVSSKFASIQEVLTAIAQRIDNPAAPVGSAGEATGTDRREIATMMTDAMRELVLPEINSLKSALDNSRAEVDALKKSLPVVADQLLTDKVKSLKTEIENIASQRSSPESAVAGLEEGLEEEDANRGGAGLIVRGNGGGGSWGVLGSLLSNPEVQKKLIDKIFGGDVGGSNNQPMPIQLAQMYFNGFMTGQRVKDGNVDLGQVGRDLGLLQGQNNGNNNASPPPAAPKQQ